MGMLYENKEEIEKIGKIIDFVKENNIDKDEDRLSRSQDFYHETERYNYWVTKRKFHNEFTPDILVIDKKSEKVEKWGIDVFTAYYKDGEVILILNETDINKRYAELFA